MATVRYRPDEDDGDDDNVAVPVITQMRFFPTSLGVQVLHTVGLWVLCGHQKQQITRTTWTLRALEYSSIARSEI